MPTLAAHLNRPFGYTCQTWLATDINNRHFNRKYRVWFSTVLTPANNGPSSNPGLLYQELDSIVRANDYNHSRIEQLRRRLTLWITGSPLPPPVIASLVAEITAAPIPAFRPQLWRINLYNIHVSRVMSLGQFADEYQIRDLIRQEFQVIVP
jgi:hypothetical protein